MKICMPNERIISEMKIIVYLEKGRESLEGEKKTKTKNDQKETNIPKYANEKHRMSNEQPPEWLIRIDN